MVEEFVELVSETSEQSDLVGSMVEISRELTHFISTLIGFIGLGVLLFGIVYSLILLGQKAMGKRVVLGEVRLNLGHYLVLALEFLVAKDILESIFDPSFKTLLELFLIVVIRTVLTYFLNKELSEVKEEVKEELKEHRSKR